MCVKKSCLYCKHCGFCNGGGVDFECATAYCKNAEFKSNLHHGNNCGGFDFNGKMQLILVGSDGRYVGAWKYDSDARMSLPVFVNDVKDAIVETDWKIAWLDGRHHGLKIAHLCGEREQYPWDLRDYSEFLNMVA